MSINNQSESEMEKLMEKSAMPTPPLSPRAALLSNHSFRWLISGGMISMLGDQFTLIALPWLVLRLSSDPLALGIVLALLGIPRAVFILLGGAIVDRYSPKRVMMLTKYINTTLLGLLSAILLSGELQLWMVYGFALGLGISTAFSIPAGTSMLPHVVEPAQFPIANSIMLSLRQLTMFAGPVLAGLMISLMASSKQFPVTDSYGLAAAFLTDCLSYAISAWTLRQVVTRNLSKPPHDDKQTRHLLHQVWDGLRFCWELKELRICFLYWSAIAFFIMGPMQLAMPLLATQLNNSAGTLGLLSGAHGAGTLLGMLISGIRPGMRLGNLGRTLLLIDLVVGLLFMPLGLIHHSWQAVLLLVLIASLGGYLQVAVFTWIQTQVPPQMMGRAMSMFMFIFLGIGPVSSVLTGWLMRSLSLPQLFLLCGGILIVIVFIAFAASPIRHISEHQKGTA